MGGTSKVNKQAFNEFKSEIISDLKEVKREFEETGKVVNSVDYSAGLEKTSKNIDKYSNEIKKRVSRLKSEISDAIKKGDSTLLNISLEELVSISNYKTISPQMKGSINKYLKDVKKYIEDLGSSGVGSVEIKVSPKLDNPQKIKADLEKQLQGESLKIKIEADASSANKALQETQIKMMGINSASPINVKIKGDSSNLIQACDQAKQALSGIPDSKEVKIIGLDSLLGVKSGEIKANAGDIKNALQVLIDYSGNKEPGEFFEGVLNGIVDFNKNPEVAKALETLGFLYNGTPNFKSAAAGIRNSGAAIGKTSAVIGRNDFTDDFKDFVEKQTKLERAYAQGVNASHINAISKNSYGWFLEEQDTLTGSNIAKLWGSNKFFNPDFLKATDDQVIKLIEDLKILHQEGLSFDFTGDNILYDKDKGFSVLDIDNGTRTSDFRQAMMTGDGSYGGVYSYLSEVLKTFRGSMSSSQIQDLTRIMNLVDTTSWDIRNSNIIRTQDQINNIKGVGSDSSPMSLTVVLNPVAEGLQEKLQQIADQLPPFDIKANIAFDENGTYLSDSAKESIDYIDKEALALEKIANNAVKAAEAKNKFAEANKDVLVSAMKSTPEVEKEAEALRSISNTIGEEMSESELKAIARSGNIISQTGAFNEQASIERGRFSITEALGSGQTRVVNFDYNEETQAWVGSLGQVYTKYSEVEKSVLSLDKEIIQLNSDMNSNMGKFGENYDPTAEQNLINAKTKERDLLLDALRAYSKQEEYEYNIASFVEKRNSKLLEYNNKVSNKEAIATARDLARLDKEREQENIRLSKEREKILDKLLVQENKIKNVRSVYDKELNPGARKPVSDEGDIEELNSVYSSIVSKIEEYRSRGKNATREELREIDQLIAEYTRLAKVKEDINNPIKRDLSGEDLNTSINQVIAEYDKLIERSKKHGDLTKDITDSIKDQRESLATGSKDYEAYDKSLNSLKNYKAELSSRVSQISDLEGLLNTIPALDNILNQKNSEGAFKYTEEIRNSISAIKDDIVALSKSGIDIGTEESQRNIVELKSRIDSILSDIRGSNKTSGINILSKELLASENKLNKLSSMTGSMTNEQIDRLNKLKSAWSEMVKDPTSIAKDSLIELNKEITDLTISVKSNGESVGGFFSNLGGSISKFTSSIAGKYLGWYRIVQYVREGINTVRELDSALTELRKVADASTARINQSFKTSTKTAKEFGSTITDVISVTSDWARMGYNVDQAEELARVTTLFKNVGDNMTADDASSYMISTLKGFQLEAEDASRIVDVYNQVANNFAIDTSGIGEALQRSAAALHTANTSLEQSVALVTTANSVIQNPETVGTAFKTISARIRGAKTEIEELGEETDAYVESNSKLRSTIKSITGVDIIKEGTKDEYKDIYTILLEISQTWKGLNDLEKSTISEAVAGKRGLNVFSAIVGDPEMLKKAYETAINSQGSALREQRNWEKSIQFSVDQLKAAGEELASDFIKASWIKDSIDLLTKFVNLLDKAINKFGSMIPILTTVGTVVGNGGIKGIGKKIGSGAGGIFTTKTTGSRTITFDQDGYSAALKSGMDSMWGGQELSSSINSLDELSDVYDALNTDSGMLMKSSEDLAKEFTHVEDTTKNVKTGFGVLGGALISLGISSLISLIYKSITAQEELNQKVQAATEQHTNLSNSVDDYKSQMEAAYAVLKNSDSTYEECYQARQDLYDIQSSLIEQYPEEAAGIDFVTDAVNRESEAYEQLNKIKAKSWQDTKNDINNGTWFQNVQNWFAGWGTEEGVTNYSAMVNRLENYTASGSNSVGWSKPNEAMMREFMKISGIKEFATGNALSLGSLNFEVTGDIKEVYSNLIKMQEIAERFGENRVAEDIGSVADKVKDEIESVGDFYDNYIYNEKVLTNESAKKVYEDYMEAYEGYQEARLAGDEELIAASQEELAGIFNDINTSGWDQNVINWFKGLIPELQDEISNVEFKLKFSAEPSEQSTGRYNSIRKTIEGSYIVAGTRETTNRDALQYSLGNLGFTTDEINAYVTNGRIDENKMGNTLTSIQKAMLENLQLVADNYGTTLANVLTAALEEGWVKSQTQIDYTALMSATQTASTGDEYSKALEKVNLITKDFDENQKRTWLSVQDGETDAIKQVKNWVEYLKEAKNVSKSGLISDVLGASDGFDVLATIYKDIEEGGDFNFANLDKKKFEENFKGLEEEYTKFIETISANPSDISKCQEAFDKLVDSYINQAIALDNVDESTVGVLKSMYEMYGITNAQEMAERKLGEAQGERAYKETLLVESGGDAANITGEKIQALVQEANLSDQAAAAIYRLQQAEVLANNSGLDFTQQINALNDLRDSAINANSAIAGTLGLTSIDSKKISQLATINGWSKEDTLSYLSSQTSKAINSIYGVPEAGYGDGKTPKSGGSSGSESSPKTYTWLEQAEQANQRKREAALKYLESENYSYDDMASRIGGTEASRNEIKSLEKEATKATNNWEANRKKLVNAFGEEYVQIIEEDLANGGSAYGEWMSEYTELTGKTIKDSQYNLLDNAEEYYSEMISNQEELNSLREEGLYDSATGENALLEADRERINLLKQEKELYSSEIWAKDVERIKAAMGDTEETAKLIQKILNGDVTKEGYRDIFTTEKGGTLSNEAQDAIEEAITDSEKMQDLNNDIIDAQEQLFNDQIALYEKHINQIKSESDQIQNIIDELNDSIDLREISGSGLITEGDYAALIENSKKLTMSYESQLKVLKDELSFIESEGREYSSTWYSVKSQIDSVNASIRSCAKSQAEWNEEIKKLPIERIEKYLEILDNVSSDIQNYLSINDARGITQTATEIQKQVDLSKESLTSLLSQAAQYQKNLSDYEWGTEKYQETVNAIQEIEDNISDVLVKIVEWNKQLLSIPIEKINEVNEKLGLISSALSSLGEDYDTALSGVDYIIQKQIDGINDEKDAFNELYDEKIKAIQKVVDALEKENEARSHQLALEDALYDLEKANNQKTIQTIKDGRLEYVADQEAIREAQQQLDQAQYENQLYLLQEQIDALEKERENQNEIYDDQLDKLSKQAEKWSEIVSNIQGARDALSATEFLGDNWIEKVLGGTDSDIYEAFKALYQGFSDQQYSVDKQIESNERLVSVMQAYVDAYTKGEITYDKALAGIQAATQSFENGITGTENLLNTLKIFGEGDLPAILKNVSNMVTAEAGAYSEYFKLTEANNQIISSYTTTWQSLVTSVDTQITALKLAYEAAEAAAKATTEAAQTISAAVSSSSEDTSIWHGESGYVYSGPGYEADLAAGTVPAKYHDGIGLGYVGSMSSDDKLEALRAMSLRPLGADEIPAILKRGELVLTSDQQGRMLSNLSRLNRLGQVSASGMQTVVNMNLSNLTFNEVQNGQDFAQYIVNNLSSAVQQGINKR